MKLKTSDFLLSRKAQLQQIVDILGQEFSYVSILGADVSGKSYTVRSSGFSIKPSEDSQRGFVVRVFQENGFSEYSFNDLDVKRVCERVREIAKADRLAFLKNNPPVNYPKAPTDEKAEHFFVGEVEQLPTEDNPKEILEKMSEAHDRVKANYPKVVQLILEMSVIQVNKIFLSKNKDLYQSYAFAIGGSVAIASDRENTQQDMITKSGICGLEMVDELENLADIASMRAEELLHAEAIEAGEYDIICDPEFTGLIAHEAFGHGAEMDMFVKNRAKGQEYLNQRVASDKVVMHDGACACEEVSSYLFDDEGNLGKDTVIIQNGILKHGMCDELSAILLGIEPTGNGKRESYKRKAYTRMTNTFFEEGTDSLEDMIDSIKFGYLLEGFSSGMEDPKNWGIQCVASKAREIVDGKLSGKVVSPVYLTGYVPELLESISMVSPGIVLSGAGHCGKGWKELVRTSMGGSYIKARGRLS